MNGVQPPPEDEDPNPSCMKQTLPMMCLSAYKKLFLPGYSPDTPWTLISGTLFCLRLFFEFHPARRREISARRMCFFIKVPISGTVLKSIPCNFPPSCTLNSYIFA